jgi:hypothetical protein
MNERPGSGSLPGRSGLLVSLADRAGPIDTIVSSPSHSVQMLQEMPPQVAFVRQLSLISQISTESAGAALLKVS